jgi:DNA mismatch repair protein MSH4
MYLAFAAAAAVLAFVDAGGAAPAAAAAAAVDRLRLSPGFDALPGTVTVTCARSEHFISIAPATARCLEIGAPIGARGEAAREPSNAKARSVHWSPYDRVRVVNADP